MNKNLWQKVQPHVLAIAVFLLVSIFYCMPAFKGMVVNQHDVISWKGMAQQSVEFKEKYGHFPLWTNSLFSGMPGYQVYMESKYNVTVAWLDAVFRFGLPTPAGLFFLSCLCFYLLAQVMRMKSWVAVFASLGYAFASYNAIITAVGHTTKFASMGYAPAVIAGFILLTQGKYIWGFITTMLFSTLMIYQNHIQIVYYTLLILVLIGLAFLVQSIRTKAYAHLLKAGSLALGAGLIAGASYAVMLMPLNEYAKETMRGGRSELTVTKQGDEKTKGGLDKDYAFKWSYGIDETLTFVLPAFKGGSSGPQELGDKSKAAENLVEVAQQSGIPEGYVNQLYGFLSAYWGPQTLGTSGPVYFGVLIVLLFIAGIFLIRSWHVGWILGATMLGLILAWGSNLSGINYFLFDYLPVYNKFRAPSMALVIPQLTFALLAGMALNEILYGEISGKELLKKLYRAAATAMVLGVILTGIYFISDFKGPVDKDRKETMTNAFAQITAQQPKANANPNAMSASIFNGLSEDRKSLYGGDLLRFWLLLALGGGLLYWGAQRKIAASYVAIGCTVLLLGDLLTVDTRYFSSKNFIAEDELMAALEPTAADLAIKQDTGYYRVFDQSSGDPFNDSRGAYHHNLINGYHPAKLGLYQDLIENQISKSNLAVFNMLNTKYVLVSNPQNGQAQALPNPGALGPCWLVPSIVYVKNADEEMKALDSIKPLETVYIDEKEKSKVTVMPQPDSTARIRFIENKNDLIRYESESSAPQFAVFSEIYYPHGWKAFVDGKEQPIVKVNYCFRGLSLAPGKHQIEFRFEPKTKETGDLISLAIGSLSWLILIGGLFWEWKKSRNKLSGTKA